MHRRDDSTMTIRNLRTTPPPHRRRRRAAALAAVVLTVCAVPAAAQTASPSSPEALARARNCMSCHAVERVLLGPSFEQIGRRYAGRANAVDEMARKIVAGGAGDWGRVPMPANTQVTPQEARLLAQWILTQ